MPVGMGEFDPEPLVIGETPRGDSTGGIDVGVGERAACKS